jgi:adenosine deaminase
MNITPENVIRAPKVLLHDHLDGGVRPQTIIDLAREGGYDGLPSTDPQQLREVISRGADRNDLVLYLETFAHTVAVMQSREALERVAAECAEDLAADGVVYAEIRFAPELHIEGGLGLDEVVEAVLAGLERGSSGRGLTLRVLCSAMRQQASSLEIAELALRHRDEGVCGFDIAGPEAGHPPSRHLDAFSRVMRAHFHITIHAGEAFGLPSIAEALHVCGAERLGHGVRLIDDITPDGEGGHVMGRLAAFVRDRRVPLEMCPSSNVHVGATPSLAQHPIGLLAELRFRVTVNTDNRLMSDTTLSREFQLLAETFDWDLDDMRWATINAMKSAFLPFDERLHLINRVIKPGYSMLGADG